jgi:predicted DsbA family dithiol-disulfide isomerase
MVYQQKREGDAMAEKLQIEYFTDILCVWAWVVQQRLEELEREFGDRIEVRYRCIDVFGDVADKITRQWSARGGYAGFAEHVAEAARSTGAPPVHCDLWTAVRPLTSATAHIFLKAVEMAEGCEAGKALALRIRQAFFNEARDICQVGELRLIADSIGLDGDRIDATLGNGTAIAAVMQDYQLARNTGIRGSPSFVLDGGRQVLYGNVGYPVLKANIEGLLGDMVNEASWC